jgi:hypothetical protein
VKNFITHCFIAGTIKELPIYFFKADDIANQLTLMEFEKFEKLRPKEFLNLNWSTEARKLKAPNIHAMAQHSNKIGQWIATEIIKVSDLEQRANCLSMFIQTAQVRIYYFG